MDINEEIEIAKDIVFTVDKPEFLSYILTGNYNDYSFIFRVTNERINTKPYIDTIKDKERILSVIASGDQILNSILFGSKDIDGFDISIFPKRYLKLKMAAVEALDLKDFNEFFYGGNALNRKMYKTISNHLKGDDKLFWDPLIYREDVKDEKRGKFSLALSELFCTDFSSLACAKENNPYMEESNYKELKSKIKNINLRLFKGDIFILKDKLPRHYDLINLSSIITATNMGAIPFSEHKKLFEGFKLKRNGEILSYVFDYDFDDMCVEEVIPNDEDYKCVALPKDNGFEDAILVYKKLK